MDNEQNKHPHAELIKAWKDGATIQRYLVHLGEWADVQNNDPAWDIMTHYRVKPKNPAALGVNNGVDGKALSDGELELIRAIRQAEISYAWERNAAILVDKESFEVRRDFIAFITCSSSDNEDDEIRYALNKISREQEQEANND